MSKVGSLKNIGTSISLAVSHLRRGGIVAFPTETYYGLAVDPDCSTAVYRLFTAKKRRADKPLLLLIEKVEQLNKIVQEVPAEYWPLMEKYWPGPLTLVFQAKNTVSPQITGQTGTVGVRISPHPIAQELVRQMGKAITATSANISGLPPARSAQEVAEMLGNSLDYIIDGGQTNAGLCSTVLGFRHGKLNIIRHGLLDLSDEPCMRQV